MCREANSDSFDSCRGANLESFCSYRSQLHFLLQFLLVSRSYLQLEVTTVQEPPVPGSEAVQVRKNDEPEPARHTFRRFRFLNRTNTVHRRFKTRRFSAGSGPVPGWTAGSIFVFFLIYSFIVLITNYTL